MRGATGQEHVLPLVELSALPDFDLAALLAGSEVRLRAWSAADRNQD